MKAPRQTLGDLLADRTLATQNAGNAALRRAIAQVFLLEAVLFHQESQHFVRLGCRNTEVLILDFLRFQSPRSQWYSVNSSTHSPWSVAGAPLPELCVKVHSMTAEPAISAIPETRYVQIAGIDVFIEGEGAQAIVMVHGWPDTYRLWDDQVAFLKDRFRCIRFTLPGFDIARPRQAHSLDALVATLKTVIATTCPGEKVTLMLHDWGCLFGYQFAMRHPSLVERIVGVDIGDAGSPAHARSMSAKAKAMVFGYQIWLALAWRIGGSLGDRMTRAMARALRCPSDPQFIGSNMCYPYYIRWFGAHGSYRHLVAFNPSWPMLYLYGGRKPFQFHSTEWAEALRQRPGSQALEFASGHWVMKSKPQEFNQAVGAWLDSFKHIDPEGQA